MLRQATALAAAILLTGCTATTSSPEGSSASTEVTGRNILGGNTNDATMAAFAARAQRPGGNAQQSQYTALVTSAGAIQVINPTDQPLNDGTLWINGKYVAQVPPIAPRGTATIDRNHIFDRDGHTMDWSAEKLNKLELQSGDQLYTVNGPAYMSR
jgi:hypothetical protein